MNSFTCCKCCTNIPGGLQGLFIHLKFVHLISSSTSTKLVCAEPNCNKTFWCGSTYRRHLQQTHNEVDAHGERNLEDHQAEPIYENDPDDVDLDDNIQEPSENMDIGDIKDSVAVYIARLRATAIPATVIQYVIEESKELLENVVGRVSEKLSPLLTEVRNGFNPTREMVSDAENVLEETKCIFEALKTPHKQIKYLKEAGFLVEPVEKQLGTVF